MAKVTIKGIPRLKESVVKLFNEIKSDPNLLLEIGDTTVDLTRSFNRSGKSPSGPKYDKNSTPWEFRKLALTKTNEPSEFYSYGLSNVTFTGQFLNSLGIDKINRAQGSVTIDFSDKERKPYKNVNGTSVGSDNTPTNKQLFKYLKEKGRLIFGINKQMENVINRIVRKYLNTAIKKTFPNK